MSESVLVRWGLLLALGACLAILAPSAMAGLMVMMLFLTNLLAAWCWFWAPRRRRSRYIAAGLGLSALLVSVAPGPVEFWVGSAMTVLWLGMAIAYWVSEHRARQAVSS